jgi:hypothetical protein
LFATLQLTGTVVPEDTEAKAVQESEFREETINGDGELPEESLQTTAVIAVAATMVRLAVAVSVDCTWEVAVIVTMLVLGTVAGAVYSPLVLSIDPLPVPPTDQFTSVLLAFRTVAVHCAVPRTITSAPVPWVGTHEAVMDGVTAVLAVLPQELKIAGTAISATKKKTRSQRTLPRPKWKFDSSTRNPPARTTLIFPEKIFLSPYPGGLFILRQDKQVEPVPHRSSKPRMPRSERTLLFAVRKCFTNADEFLAPEIMFSLCRRNPASAHLQPTWWQDVKETGQNHIPREA